MDVVLSKNSQPLAQSAKKSTAEKKLNSRVAEISPGDELIETKETSDGLTSLSYVSSKGFFFQ